MKLNLNKMKITSKKLIVDQDCYYKNSKAKTKIKKNKINKNRNKLIFLSFFFIVAQNCYSDCTCDGMGRSASCTL